MNIFFTIKSFERHMSSEGHQLQEGLRHNGWLLAGRGLDIDCTDIHQVLKEHKPERVLIQDQREWNGFYELNVPSERFTNLHALRSYKCMMKGSVIKDAQNFTEKNKEFFDWLNLDTCVHYYDKGKVLALNPWLQFIRMVRTTHTIDKNQIPLWNNEDRCVDRAIFSGAVCAVSYPLRDMIAKKQYKKVDKIPHPTYHSNGTDSTLYLMNLSRYKVAICTCSIYEYLLRKIIEASCCGCYVLTNLQVEKPSFLSLIELDGPSNLDTLVPLLCDMWESEVMKKRAEIACNTYDFRESGMRLNHKLCNKD